MKWKKHVQKRFKGHDAYPLVEVLWHDAVASALDWEEEIDLSPRPTVSIGYLIESNPDSITIVSIVNDYHIAHGLTIPTGCIVRMVELVIKESAEPQSSPSKTPTRRRPSSK